MRFPNPFGDKDKDTGQQGPGEAEAEGEAQASLYGSGPQGGSAPGESWMAQGQEPFASTGEEPAPIYGQSQGAEPIRWGAPESTPPPAPESQAPESQTPESQTPEPPAPEPPSSSPEEPQPSSEPEPAFTWEQPAARASEPSSRVSVVDEPSSRPAPPAGASEEEYKWHTYKVYPSGRPDAIEFIDTYKAFGRNRILRGLNMGLPEGMVSMILGPSGTGKSVCIKHMVGLLYPDEGDILVHGNSVPNMPDDDLFEMRKKFGLLFQDGALFGSMNLYDNVAFPLRQHTEKGEQEIEDIVMRRLNEVGLGSAREKYPNELSGGMRKRAGFARALVLEPDIVLFDEPDSGLDPVRTALLGELILEIHRDMMEEAKAKQREHLPTFAVITHDIMSARRVADYINVLWKGRIVEAGPAEDMLNSENPFIRQFLAGESQGPLTMD
ncbi:MAG TPA: ATP-binding cassette domain-containing protein [Solirubrobacteraceae bacterium]|nr:ATP-binding cassette domain-containing protein [Solirubrobacteraceae bacterium]